MNANEKYDAFAKKFYEKYGYYPLDKVTENFWVSYPFNTYPYSTFGSMGYIAACMLYI